MKKIFTSRSPGISLVELAFVIAILSTIAVMSFIAYDFFSTKTRVTNIAIDSKEYQKSVESFHLIYGGLPGDLASATRRINADLTNGDGDGRIQNEQEQFQVWTHLSESGILKNAGGDKYQSLPLNTTPILGVHMPIVRNSDDLTIGVIYNTPSGFRQNSFIIGRLNGREVSVPTLTQEQIKFGDRKYDDGKPTSGGWMCGTNPPGISDCDYNNVSKDAENFMLYLPITRGTMASSSSSCPAQSLQIGQLVANIPDVAADVTHTGNCRNINANYAGTYQVECKLQTSGQHTLDIIHNSCTLKECSHSYTTSSDVDILTMQTGNVQVGNNLNYTCGNSKVPKPVKCLASLVDDTAYLNLSPECVNSTSLGVSGNIPIYDTESTFIDSGKKISDVGDTSNDLFSANRIFELLGKGSIANNSLTKFNATANKLTQSMIFDNGTSTWIGGNAPNSKAILDMSSTTQGFLPPRVTTTQRNAIGPATGDIGLTVYNTSTNSVESWSGTTWGDGSISSTDNAIVRFNGTDGKIQNSSNVVIDDSGNVGIGTTAPTKKLDVTGDILVNGITVGRGSGNIDSNLVVGNGAGAVLTSGGISNTFIGKLSGNKTTTGAYNTALGYSSLLSNTTGTYNTALGYSSLSSNTTGQQNTAIGKLSLLSNTTGNFNTAIGRESLLSNGTGYHNTAIGTSSLKKNTTGYFNTALGSYSLGTNTTGKYNTAIGMESLYFNTTGNYNTAIGRRAGMTLTTGNNNTIIGASVNLPTANTSNSIAIGDGSGATRIFVNSSGNVGIGTTAPNSKAILDVSSTTRGFLPPRVTTTQRNAISPTTGDIGLTVYNTSTKSVESWSGTTWGSGDDSISSTDNAIVRFNGTDGKIQNSSNVVIDDSGNVGIGTTAPTK
ncbi:MAG: hypothetical protein ACI9CD_001130, partial [Candidatus Deianiraeaceae bacterium]